MLSVDIFMARSLVSREPVWTLGTDLGCFSALDNWTEGDDVSCPSCTKPLAYFIFTATRQSGQLFLALVLV